MVSIDPRQVELITQFAAFAEFLKDPSKVAKILTDFQIAKKEHDLARKQFEEFESAQAYVFNSEAKLAEKKQALALLEQKFEEGKKEFLLQKEKEQFDFDTRKENVSKREAQLEEKILQFLKEQEKANIRALEIRAAENVVAQRQQKLDELDAILQAKAKALQQLLK